VDVDKRFNAVFLLLCVWIPEEEVDYDESQGVATKAYENVAKCKNSNDKTFVIFAIVRAMLI
jgi:hypothetical protein